jgi:hypothetical protein
MNTTVSMLYLKTELTLKTKKQLINENAVMELLGNELPSTNELMERKADSSNVYKTIQYFADFTKQLIQNGNFKEVKHCFKIADKMLQQGNSAVKNAIENVFVFSLSSVLDMSNPICDKVKSLLTDSLRKEYQNQVNASGI